MNRRYLADEYILMHKEAFEKGQFYSEQRFPFAITFVLPPKLSSHVDVKSGSKDSVLDKDRPDSLFLM